MTGGRPLFTIRVPATSANLGPGFDSLGLALGFGLEVAVHPAEPPGSWLVEPLGPNLDGLPYDEENLIVRTALDVAARHGVRLPPHRLVLRSGIPLARGLGSSAAAVVAGVELANEVAGLGLGDERRIDLAARVEGHPDNVAAAILGGLVIAAMDDAKTTVLRAHLPPADVVLAIPEYSLPTATARAVLPREMPYRTAVLASARGNALVAALLLGDWTRAGELMRGDLFHEPHRAGLVPGLAALRDLVYEAVSKGGAYGAALSGAGPTLIAFAPVGHGPALAATLHRAVPRYAIHVTAESRRGVTVSRLA